MDFALLFVVMLTTKSTRAGKLARGYFAVGHKGTCDSMC